MSIATVEQTEMEEVASVDANALVRMPEVVGNANASLAVSLARAEVDQQITTAKSYPRSVTRARDNILELTTLDEQTAAECMYALPRGGKPIKGPSIRLAEIVVSQFGNCRIGARVVHVDRIEKYVEAEGVFHDLETNTATTSRVRRRLSDRHGRLLNEDMIVVTGNAACAIAKRNAILAGVPRGVWRVAYEAAERVVAGDIRTLSVRREQAMKAFAAFGVKPEQIFAVLDVGGLDDVGLDELGALTGMHSALKSGEATVEEMFAKPTAEEVKAAKSGGLAGKMERLANGGQKKPADLPPHDPETGEIADTAPKAGAVAERGEDVPATSGDASAEPPTAAGEADGASPAPGAPEPEEPLPDTPLFKKIKTAVSRGTKRYLLAVGGLTEAEREEIQPFAVRLEAMADSVSALGDAT